MVPVVSIEGGMGRWVVPAPLQPMLKPGGHGAIWKLAKDDGVFDWFAQAGRTAALVRQISNPMAGTDATMLGLAGIGSRQSKAMGFASCERYVGVAEGVNVLRESRSSSSRAGGAAGEWQYSVTNVEYTEFPKLGIQVID